SLVDFVQTNEPRVIAFNEYVSEDGGEVAVVQIHPDAGSMAFHMEVIAERAASAYADTIDATTSIQVFGTPSDAVVEMLRRQAGQALRGRLERQDPVLRAVHDEDRHVDLRQVGSEVGQPGVDARVRGMRRRAGGDVEARLPRLLTDSLGRELVDVVEVVEEVL